MVNVIKLCIKGDLDVRISPKFLGQLQKSCKRAELEIFFCISLDLFLQWINGSLIGVSSKLFRVLRNLKFKGKFRLLDF